MGAQHDSADCEAIAGLMNDSSHKKAKTCSGSDFSTHNSASHGVEDSRVAGDTNPDVEYGPLEIKVGCQVTVYDEKDSKFHQSKILALKEKEDLAQVHFLGWDSKYDCWISIHKLRRPEFPRAIPPPPAPTAIAVKNCTSSEAVVEVCISEHSPAVKAYIFQLDDEPPSRACKFDKGSEPTANTPFLFTVKSLVPGVPYIVKVALIGEGRKGRPAKPGEWSQELAVLLEEAEEEAEELTGKRAAAAKAQAASAKQLGRKSESDSVAPRREADPLLYHQAYCSYCFGGEREGESRLLACAGGCKRRFHAACVGVDEGEAETEWSCATCCKGKRTCEVCQTPSDAGTMVSCALPSCRRSYHAKCLEAFAEKHFGKHEEASFEMHDGVVRSCPRHRCVACADKEGNDKASRFHGCVRCPANYHRRCLNSFGILEASDEMVASGKSSRKQSGYFVCTDKDDHRAAVSRFEERKSEYALQSKSFLPAMLKAIHARGERPCAPFFEHLWEAGARVLPSDFRLPVRYAEARNYQGNKPAPFKLLKTNMYRVPKPRLAKEDISICACGKEKHEECASIPVSLSDRLPVGCGDHCENRLTLTECLASVCPLGDRCGNQRLQKRLYPRLELFKTSSRGFGLRALEDIPKDALVQEYIGEVMGADEFLERTKNYGQNTPVYFFNLDADLVIDASDKGSMARFINHSCGPNCRTEKWAVGGETRIGIMADQMIPKGTEVTYNYQFESFGETRHVCLCGANNCSGFLGVRPKNEKDAADAKKKKKKKGGHAGAAPAAPLADVGPARDPRLLRWVRGSDEGGALCEGMLLKTEGEYGLVAGAAGAAAEAFGEWLPLAGLNLAELPDEGDTSPAACHEGAAASTLGAATQARDSGGSKTQRVQRVTDDKIEALRADRTVQVLQIRPPDGALPAEVLGKLCAALAGHPSLQALDLQGVNVGAGAGALAALVDLSRGGRVRDLDLQYCGIDDAAAAPLLAALGRAAPAGEGTPRVRRVDLGNNSLSRAGPLHTLLRKRPTLSLLLKGNKALAAELPQLASWFADPAEVRELRARAVAEMAAEVAAASAKAAEASPAAAMEVDGDKAA